LDSVEKNRDSPGFLKRTRRVLDSPQAARVREGGRELVNFSSNDYLGLANDARLREAAIGAIEAYGVGAGASPLVTGHSRLHQEAEETFAQFVGLPRSLLFPSGYAANLGILATLADRHAEIFADKLNHACLNDGAILSRATFTRYAHLDLGMLDARPGRLACAGARGRDRRGLQHGWRPRAALRDGAYLRAPRGMARRGRRPRHRRPGRARTWLARSRWNSLAAHRPHGDAGQGPGRLWGVRFGRGLRHRGAPAARAHYMYSTALPPMAAAVAKRAVEILAADGEITTRLHRRIAEFRAACGKAGVALLDSTTPIQPVVVGSAARALAVSARLRDAGFLVPAIRPPTVPEGTSRLRISISAAHERAEVESLAAALSLSLA
jgi:8-amino-7-oxononanoate synthase